MPQTLEPTPFSMPAPRAPTTSWVKLWLNVGISTAITLVWLALALVAAARGDWLIMGIDVAAAITGVAALVWTAHALLQLADAEALSAFAYRLAEDRFDAMLALHLAEAECAPGKGWVQ